MMKIATSNQASIDAARKRELGWIHQGRTALQWSEDDYRFHLKDQTGKTSAKDLTASERAKFLRHLAACGWQHKSRQDRPFDQAAKIRWYWRKLAAIGAVREPGESALLAWVARTTGQQVSDLRFLPTAPAITAIEGLKAWLQREERKGTVKQ